MKNNKTLVIWIIVLLAMSLILAMFPVNLVQADGDTDTVSQDNPYAEVDAYIEKQMKALNIPGASLAIVEGDQIVHLKGFGVSSPAGETPTPETSFVICSLTKSFTALAVMQLVEAGKVELDAPIQRYLPWFTLADPKAAALITVRQLLNQNSGLPEESGWKALVNFDDSLDASEKQARSLATTQPNRPVGSTFEYNNTNYNLLGLIIEAASGEKYADYVQKHIFDPLEMTHTYTSKVAAKQNGMSTGYITWFGFPQAVPDLRYPSASLPSGQLISSTGDMAHYLIAQLNGGRYGDAQIVSPESLTEMHSPAVKAITKGVDMGSYSMGWFIEEKSQGTSIWHDGTAPDYFAFMALLPDQNKGFVVLFNANEFMTNLALNFIGGDIATLLMGGQAETIPWAVVPWTLRVALIVPVVQMLGVLFTLLAIRRWRKDASRRPGQIRKWVHIVLPAIPNLFLVYCAFYFVTSGVLVFWFYFMGDVTGLVLVCGAIALVWTSVRTWLILKTLRTPAVAECANETAVLPQPLKAS